MEIIRQLGRAFVFIILGLILFLITPMISYLVSIIENLGVRYRGQYHE